VVQVREIPADALVRGTVVSVRRTGEFVETYDIGVARNHNFFADGILIHNCQHDAASSMAHLHNVIQPKWTLGLSATPFRCDRVKLCFDRVVKDAGIHQLIQDGYLSEFDHYTIPGWDADQVSQFYGADSNRWGKSIFFFHTLRECFALQESLRSRGILSEVVTGTSDRDTQLDAFRNGDLQVLINCMVLTEGFDDPTLQTVWVRPSGRGPTIQMAGRALRKFQGLPVKQIVQCNQTPHPFVKTAHCRDQYLWQSGEWRSLQMNPLLNLCNNNVRRAMAQAKIELPSYLRKGMHKRRTPVRY
jgi:superfamily II DNA or RNA helicase